MEASRDLAEGSIIAKAKSQVSYKTIIHKLEKPNFHINSELILILDSYWRRSQSQGIPKSNV